MESGGAVAGADTFEFGAEHSRVDDGEQVGVLGFDVAPERFDPGLVGRGGRASEVLAALESGMNVWVSSERISGPISDAAKKTGAAGSDRFTSPGWSRRHSSRSRSPSPSRAFTGL